MEVSPKRKLTGPGKIGLSLRNATIFHPCRSNCACNDLTKRVSKRSVKRCPKAARVTKNAATAPSQLPESARALPLTGPQRTPARRFKGRVGRRKATARAYAGTNKTQERAGLACTRDI